MPKKHSAEQKYNALVLRHGNPEYEAYKQRYYERIENGYQESRNAGYQQNFGWERREW